MDGCTSTEKIREFLYQKNKPQPVIVGVSGQIEDEYVKQAIKRGMN